MVAAAESSKLLSRMSDPLREELDRRPLIVLGAGLVVGLTAIAHPLNLLAIPILLLWLIRRSGRVLLAAGLAIGLVLTPSLPTSILVREKVDEEGTVVSVPRAGAYGSSFNFATPSRVWRATVKGVRAVRLGEELRLSGVGRPLREGSEAYLELHGVSGNLTVASMEVRASSPMLWRISAAWRESFGTFVHRWLPDEAAALTEAICFDMSSGLDPATTSGLRDSGTLHIVAASGLHVFLIAGALLGVLSAVALPRLWQIVLLAMVLAIYAGATGLSPAVVRASFMSVVGLSAYLFRREPDALSALALSGIAFLLWQPREIYDPGFQISFVTVGGIALFFHRERRGKSQLVRLLIDSAKISWVAFAASAPLLSYYFGTLSLVTLPGNMLIGVGASIGLVSALAAHMVSLVFPALGVGILTVVTGPMIGWVLWISQRLSGHVWSTVGIPGFSAYWLPIVYGLLLLTWRQRIVQP